MYVCVYIDSMKKRPVLDPAIYDCNYFTTKKSEHIKASINLSDSVGGILSFANRKNQSIITNAHTHLHTHLHTHTYTYTHTHTHLHLHTHTHTYTHT